MSEQFGKFLGLPQEVLQTIANCNPPEPDIRMGDIAIELTELVVPHGRKNEAPYKASDKIRDISQGLDLDSTPLTGRIAINVFCKGAHTDDYKLPDTDAFIGAINQFIKEELTGEFFSNYSSRRPYLLPLTPTLRESLEQIWISPGRPIRGDPTIQRQNQPKIIIPIEQSLYVSDFINIGYNRCTEKGRKEYSTSAREKWLLLWTRKDGFIFGHHIEAIELGVIWAIRNLERPFAFDRVYFYSYPGFGTPFCKEIEIPRSPRRPV